MYRAVGRRKGLSDNKWMISYWNEVRANSSDDKFEKTNCEEVLLLIEIFGIFYLGCIRENKMGIDSRDRIIQDL